MKLLKIINKIRWIYARIEDVLVGLFMTGVIFISVGQILCRWLHINGMVWSDGFMRYSVLWIAMLGAGIAARESQHITVEITSLFLKGRAQAIYKAVIDLLATIIATLLFVAAWDYWQEEMEMEQLAFANISTGTAFFIMPYSLAIITIRFLLNGLDQIKLAIHPQAEEVQ